jgi:DNA-directed RNA polymerase subunit beta'
MIISGTLKPVFNGLFCEKIFGPLKDFECSCKRYKRVPQKNKKKVSICSDCNVELTQSKIRNYRMG